MGKRRLKTFFYYVGRAIQLLSGLAIILFALLADSDAENFTAWPDFAKNSISWARTNAFELWISIGIASTIGYLLVNLLGKPWIWSNLQAMLDEFQRDAYKGLEKELNDHHRVTIFKHVRWAWTFNFKRREFPWSGWLVPVLRSGCTSQKSKAQFFCPDDGRLARGIAGKAWACNSIITVSKLPKMHVLQGQKKEPGKRRVNEYAKLTGCAPEFVQAAYVDQDKAPPLSISAIPLEVSGKLWGVLVLDSQSPERVTDDLIANFTMAIFTISRLLEKA